MMGKEIAQYRISEMKDGKCKSILETQRFTGGYRTSKRDLHGYVQSVRNEEQLLFTSGLHPRG